MPAQYISILFFALLCAAFPAATFAVLRRLRPASPSESLACESGEGEAHVAPASRTYSARFFIVVSLFVILEVATIFLVPWAVEFGQLGVYGLLTMAVFLGFLSVGYVWLYRSRFLDWL